MTDCAHENAVSGVPHGVLEGDIPFKGNLVDEGSVRKIGGGIQWHAHLPDSNPEEGKLNVVVVLFVDWDDAVGRVGQRPRGRLRLDGEFVSRLERGGCGRRGDGHGDASGKFGSSQALRHSARCATPSTRGRIG